MKLRNLVLLWIIFCLALFAKSQTTVVTATITAPDGNAFANGTVVADFLPPGGTINQQNYKLNGNPFPYSVTGTMNGSGTFVISLTDESFVRPTGGRWRFTMCSMASFPCSVSVQDVIGATINLSTLLSTDVRAITGNPIFVGRFFQDSEVVTNTQGGLIYFNLTSKVFRGWDGSAWANIASGSGNAGTGACASNQVVTAVNVGIPTCDGANGITSAFVDSSILTLARVNAVNGVVGIDGSNNVNLAGNLVVTGNVTVNGILQFLGALNLQSPIPVVGCNPSSAANSSICLHTDGDFYISNNTGAIQEVVSRLALGFGAGAAGTAVTTTTKAAGTGPTTPQTIVQYMSVKQNGTTYWVPLVQ